MIDYKYNQLFIHMYTIIVIALRSLLYHRRLIKIEFRQWLILFFYGTTL